jgi:orotate phosphoribosyltransferase
MTEKELFKIFKTEKALLSGHFLLSSGLHSPGYLQCALVLQKPRSAQKLCTELARKFTKLKPQVVIGPALGGMIVSYEVARALKVRSIFAERVEGIFKLRRGFQIKKNERVLVVEDVITTGKSTYEVIELVKASGGILVGVGSLIDRSGSCAVFEDHFYSLAKVALQTYKPQECPLCRENKIPLIKPGSRGLNKT